MTVLVMSAHGNQGRLLLPKLARAGVRVRALRGAGPREELLALGASEAITGNAADPAVLDRALEGIDTVYHVGPSAHPQERAMGMLMIEAAQSAGVRHFVYSSVLHPIISAMPHHALKRDIEEALICSRLNWTILQPADYMQIKNFRDSFETGAYERWWSFERREELVDLDDVTDVAVRVIREGSAHYGASYPLSSGDALTGDEIAEAIARVVGRPIERRQNSAADFLQEFFGAAETDPAAAYTMNVLKGLNAWYDKHDFIGNPAVLTMLLGRKPNSCEAMVRREYAAWQAARR